MTHTSPRGLRALISFENVEQVCLQGDVAASVSLQTKSHLYSEVFLKSISSFAWLGVSHCMYVCRQSRSTLSFYTAKLKKWFSFEIMKTDILLNVSVLNFHV